MGLDCRGCWIIKFILVHITKAIVLQIIGKSDYRDSNVRQGNPLSWTLWDHAESTVLIIEVFILKGFKLFYIMRSMENHFVPVAYVCNSGVWIKQDRSKLCIGMTINILHDGELRCMAVV